MRETGLRSDVRETGLRSDVWETGLRPGRREFLIRKVIPGMIWGGVSFPVSGKALAVTVARDTTAQTPLRFTAVTAAGELVTDAGILVALAGLWQPSPLPVAVQAAELALVQERSWLWSPVPALEIDRYGRQRGDLTAAGQPSLCAALLQHGLAATASTAPASRLPSWLAQEAAARQAGHGLWAERRYAPRTPAQAESLIGSFQIIEGTVQAASQVRNRVYLNFGPDWRHDFTITLTTRRKLPFVPAALAGQTVRARGWLRFNNGPMLVLENPALLERLPAPLHEGGGP